MAPVIRLQPFNVNACSILNVITKRHSIFSRIAIVIRPFDLTENFDMSKAFTSLHIAICFRTNRVSTAQDDAIDAVWELNLK